MLPTDLEDLIGIEYSKLDFFQELQHTIKELQEANKESENQRREISAILDGITDVMMVLSEDLRIISVNHVFQELFGMDDPEGVFCYSLFRDAGEPCPECPAFRSLSTNTVCKETAIFTINGRRLQYEMVASPLKSPDMQENRVLIFKRDVTMEKEYQAKYLQAEKMATVGVLATGVAHEVNNPLMAISGYAEGIQRRLAKTRGQVPPELQEHLAEYTDTIVKECSRCREIVRSLLNFCHPVASLFSPANLNDIVTETLKLLQYKLKNQDRLSVELLLDPHLPHIHADEPRLKQVLLNLLTNASDALEGKPGSITVRTWLQQSQECVFLEVEDSGHGIPAAIKDKLFDPFFTTKAVGKGIGIGLSTCYNIVKEHHGDIDVISEEGKGSRFIVCLPVQQGNDSD